MPIRTALSDLLAPLLARLSGTASTASTASTAHRIPRPDRSAPPVTDRWGRRLVPAVVRRPKLPALAVGSLGLLAGLASPADAQLNAPSGGPAMLPPGATVPANFAPAGYGPAGAPVMPPAPGMMPAPGMLPYGPAPQASYGPGKSGGTYDPTAVTPAGYLDPAGSPAGPQGPGALWPPTGNRDLHPWPAISPFEPANVKQTSHTNRKGLWFQDKPRMGRKYKFNTEGVWFKISQPDNDIIGSRIIPLEGNQIWLPTAPRFTPSAMNRPTSVAVGGAGGGGGGGTINDLEIGGSALDDVIDQLPPSVLLFSAEPRVFPYPFISDETDPATGDDLITTVLNEPLFPVRTTDDISGDEHSSGGVRLTWGWDEADGTGFELSGFFMAQTDEEFRMGTPPTSGIPILDPLQGVTNLSGQVDPTLFALPLDTGFSTFPLFPDLNIVGFTQKFDLYTSLSYQTEAHGANFVVLNKVIARRGNALVRMGFGADYLYVGDSFGFVGIDSGLDYEIDDLEVTDGIVNAGGGGGGGAGAGGAGGGIDFVADNFNFVTPALTDTVNEPFLAELDSNVESYLGGPTFALRYEAGGKKFKMIGESAFSLLVNHERTRISGSNIGEQTAMKTLYGIDFLNETEAIDAGAAGATAPTRDTSFTDRDSHTHLSPMFKQSVKAELDLARTFPVFEKFYLTEHAKFTGAYQLSYINRMQRASAAINWQGFPLFPTVRSQYDDFYLHEFRLGLQMEY